MGNIDFVRKSKMDNVQKFVGSLTDKQLNELCEYMLYNFQTEKPDKIQKQFTDEFIGESRWATFIYEGKKEGGIKWIDIGLQSDVNEFRNFLFFYQTLRFVDVFKDERYKTKFQKLKTDVKEAMENSKFDGVFDKVEGWCNVQDVLIDHGVIKEPKD